MLLRVPLLASLLAMLAAPAVNAVSTIPDEGAFPLAGTRVQSAMVGDVDGDGVLELIRLLPPTLASPQLGAQVVRMVGGLPQPATIVPLQRIATSENRDLQRRPSDDGLLGLSVNEPARLVAWRNGGQEHVLAATIGTTGLPQPCCLTLWRVGAAGGSTTLERTPILPNGTSISAASILAVDMDGDGTDELVVAENPDPDLEPSLFHRPILVMRWDGEAFVVVGRAEEQSATISPPMALGDTDGRPGVEVGFLSSPRFDQEMPTLTRIWLGDGTVLEDAGELPADGTLAPITTPDGGRLVLVNDANTLLLAWPGDSPRPAVTATSRRGGELLGVLGSGQDAAILVVRGGAVDVLDAGLTSRQGISASSAATRFIASGMAPYRGPLRGYEVSTEDAAYVFGGRLVTSNVFGIGTSSFLATRDDMAVLAGMAPIGLFGEAAGWAAVARPGAGSGAASRVGGRLASRAGEITGPVWVVPTEQLLAPEVDAGALTPGIDGGVVDATRAVPALLTSGSLSATVSGPLGSEVQMRRQSVQESIVEVITIPVSGRVEVPLATDAVGGASFRVQLLVVTPAGHGYGADWQVRVVQHAPRLNLEADGLPLSFDVGVRGTTEPGAVVEVDGRRVAVAPDGTFAATVGGGILPRDVPVRAIDQLGNVTQETVSVVALADYRLLPWVPITAVVTVGLGVLLYLRTPRSTRPSGSTGSGTLEEIE